MAAGPPPPGPQPGPPPPRPTRTPARPSGNWLSRNVGQPLGRLGRWAISSNEPYRDAFQGTGRQVVKYGSAAAGAAGGSFLGRIGTRFVVTRNFIAQKLSPKAQRAAVNTGTVAGGVAGAIGLPKLVGRALLAIASRGRTAAG